MVEKKDFAIVRRFAKRVKKDFPDARVLLFGSRSRGESLQESDFDVIVISAKFAGKLFFDRIPPLYDYWDSENSLEVFCYTPEEIETKKNRIGFVQNALKESIEIA